MYGLSRSLVEHFESNYLKLPATLDLLVLSLFTLATVGLALLSADRIFRVVGGGRTEKVITVGKEGLFLTGIRRVAPGSFGIRLVTVVKDFTRKVQNTSGMAYGVILAVIAPLLMVNSFHFDTDPRFEFFLVAYNVGLYMGIISAAMVFSGIGFLDSQDQLWIIWSSPNGAMKFVKARVVEGFLLSLVFSAVSPVILSFVFGFGILEMLALFVITYLSVCGGMLIGTGVTARNPKYDDTRSNAFGVNGLVTIVIFMGSYMGLILVMVAFRLFASVPFMLTFLTAPILIEGLVVVYIGAKRLGRQL